MQVDDYGREDEFPEEYEDRTNSEMPLNPFTVWGNLKFYNEVTDMTEALLKENKNIITTLAGIELSFLRWDLPFSLFIVHGINSLDKLTCWLFTNKEMAIKFMETELREAKIWEIKDIQLEDIRDAGGLPELVG